MGRVFLSHSSIDKPFVRELHRRLTRDGVNCFFDEENIEWGDNWVLVLEQAIKECAQIVFILTPDFCNSKWAEIERTSSMTGLNKKLLPLMRIECRHVDTFPQFLKQIQTINISTNDLFEKNYPKICKKLGGTPVIELTKVDRSTLPPVQKFPAHHRMPFRSLGDNFIGRIADLWAIHDALHNGGTAIVQGVGVLAGTGGLGKTQAAIEYAYRFAPNYPGGVYWVDADRGLSTLITQVADAAQIDINTKAPESQQLAELWRALNTRAASLLVLDNFPEEIKLQPYLPTAANVQTLVTTRRRDIQNHPHVALNLLTGTPGIALLNSGNRKFPPNELAVLVDRLGGLPLALELTKAFLNYRTDATVAQVMAHFNKRGDIDVLSGFAKQYRDELPSGHEPDVAQTFQMSWSLAPQSAQNVLRVMAHLAPVGVPRSLIRTALELPEATDLDDPLSDSISKLVRLSLVELDSNNNPVTHRLIHGFAAFRNRTDNISLFEPASRALAEAMRTAENNPGANEFAALELVLPHAEALSADTRLPPREAVNLLAWISWHHQAMGRFTLALNYAELALATAKQNFPPDDESIAISQSNLALVLHDLGQLEPARDLLSQALASAQKNFPPGHPSTAISQSNLALVLQDLGQLEPARDLLSQALASAQKNFPPGHPSTAIRQSNLALVLQDLGQLEPARDLLSQALASAQKNFPPGHPSIAISQSNLATVLQGLGQLEPARDLFSQALASAQKNFPPGHPSIATSQSNLALVLKDLGQLEPARDLLSQALASFEANFAPAHPSVITVRKNLAAVLRAMNCHAEADALLQKSKSAHA